MTTPHQPQPHTDGITKPLLATRFKLSFNKAGNCTVFRKDQAEELDGQWVWLIDATDGKNDPLYSQQPHTDGWKPIETAPRHYKTIYACDVVRCYEGKVAHNGAEWELISHDGFPMGVGFYPTHWRPLHDLPKPPSTTQSQTGR